MKLTATALAGLAWLALASSGPVWAYLLGFLGFVLTPAILLRGSTLLGTAGQPETDA